MILRHRRDFKHLSAATANDQRAFLEAAILTVSIVDQGSQPNSRRLKRMMSRIGWKIDLDREVQRTMADVRDANTDPDRMFSFIDRVRDRITTGGTAEIILNLCRRLSGKDRLNGSDRTAFLTRLDQELGRHQGRELS